MISHGNLSSSVMASRGVIPAFTAGAADTHLCYLPLCHILESLAFYCCLFGGSRIAFSSGNVRKLSEDISVTQPTMLFGVPRVFQRICSAMMAALSSLGGEKEAATRRVYERAVASMRSGEGVHSDAMAAARTDPVLAIIRQQVGLGRCHSMMTGAAPCPPSLLESLRVLVGCGVINGYGMTETAGIAVTRADDSSGGHVGGMWPSCEVKLVDVPDMGYRATDQPEARGEIWVRGPNVFLGYYGDPEATKSSLHSDGWLATGDVGDGMPTQPLPAGQEEGHLQAGPRRVRVPRAHRELLQPEPGGHCPLCLRGLIPVLPRRPGLPFSGLLSEGGGRCLVCPSLGRHRGAVRHFPRALV